MELLRQAEERRATMASPVARAVETFLQAEDETAARAIFQEKEEQLRSPQAAQLLASIEAGDPESHLYLEQRRALWRTLREQ